MSKRRNELNDAELAAVSRSVTAITTPIEEAFELFLADGKRKGLRPFTLDYYRREINSFIAFLESHRDVRFLHEVVRADLHAFVESLHERNLKAGTINAKLRAIRAMFRWLTANKYYAENPFAEYPLIKDRKGHIETFTLKQVRALLNAPNKRTFTGQRDYTLMLLLLETGIRLNETVGILVEDVRLHEGTVFIRQTKNSFHRYVPIQAKMSEQMRRYLRLRGSCESDALFVTLEGTPLSRRGIQTIISKYGAEAGIKGVRCSPHTFRHTFAKMSVMNGAGVFELQKILGHSTLEMVKTYVNLYSSEVSEKHKRFSPLNDL